MLAGVCAGPAWDWLVVVLMTGAAAAEDGVVMVTGVVECVPATIVEACISAWQVGVTGVRGASLGLALMAGLSWSLSLSRA